MTPSPFYDFYFIFDFLKDTSVGANGFSAFLNGQKELLDALSIYSTTCSSSYKPLYEFLRLSRALSCVDGFVVAIL